MLIKNIKYTDFDGNEREEIARFHLSQAEIIEMQASTDGGLENKIKRISSTQDMKEIIALFKEIILKSYGVKSDDGRRFIKSQELRDAFEQSEAYNVLFCELVQDAKAASDFISGIIPQDSKIAAKPVKKAAVAIVK